VSRKNMFIGLRSVTRRPFSTVAARECSSCCFRSEYHALKRASWLLGSRSHATFSRHASSVASRNPETMPCPPSVQYFVSLVHWGSLVPRPIPDTCTYKAERHGRHRHIIILCPRPKHCSFGQRKRMVERAILLYSLPGTKRLRGVYKYPFVSKRHHVSTTRNVHTHPYRAPGCLRYGKTIRLMFSFEDISTPSSPSWTTYSNLHNRSSSRPNRPHTAGLSGLQRNRNSMGKNRSYTCSGVYPCRHRGKSEWVFGLGNVSLRFMATQVSA
jgi:hypothetical protein